MAGYVADDSCVEANSLVLHEARGVLLGTWLLCWLLGSPVVKPDDEIWNTLRRKELSPNGLGIEALCCNAEI